MNLASTWVRQTLTLLRQAGWEIVYGYSDAGARRPVRLRITYPDLEIRMVIDKWE